MSSTMDPACVGPQGKLRGSGTRSRPVLRAVVSVALDRTRATLSCGHDRQIGGARATRALQLQCLLCAWAPVVVPCGTKQGYCARACRGAPCREAYRVWAVQARSRAKARGKYEER